MGWEHRRNRWYLYQSVRIGGRVRKRYLGTRPAAHAFARRAAEKRARRQAERADLQPEIWRSCGDLGKVAERSWLELLTSEALASESIRWHVEQLRSDLAGPHPTRTERLLVNQVVVCYLAVQHAELTMTGAGTSSSEQIGVRLRRCESAQRRYLGALRMLTLVRGTVPQGLVPPQALRLFNSQRQRGTEAG
jgi:hypothetical protein